MRFNIIHALTGWENQTLQWRVCPGHAQALVQTMSAIIDRGQRQIWRARSACHGHVRRCRVALATGVDPQISLHGRCNGTRQPAVIPHIAHEEALP